MKSKDAKIGFEVLTTTETEVVFKRVLPNNGIPKKKLKKREMDLPKVTIHFFDLEDIEHLQKLQCERAKFAEPTRTNSRLSTLKDILTR